MDKEKAKKNASKVYFAVKNNIAGVIITASLLTIFATAAGEYNTQNDPLVSLSYVQNMRTELKAEIKAEMQSEIAQMVRDEIANQAAGGGTDSGVEYDYVTVTLNAGQKLMAKSSCELMVRAGSCKAISPSSTQTLIDKSSSTSLSNGMDIVKNHLISIPKADGRGVVAVWNGTEIMVRGDYEIVS